LAEGVASLLAPFAWGACGALVVSGGYKVLTPGASFGMLSALGLTPRASLVRILGAVEICCGLGGVLFSGMALAACAGLYLCFAGAVLVSLQKGRVPASCGCFGAGSGRPGVAHLALDLVLAILLGVSTGWVVRGPASGLSLRFFVELLQASCLTLAVVASFSVLDLRAELSRLRQWR
jgi:hypothetical protein